MPLTVRHVALAMVGALGIISFRADQRSVRLMQVYLRNEVQSQMSSSSFTTRVLSNDATGHANSSSTSTATNLPLSTQFKNHDHDFSPKQLSLSSPGTLEDNHVATGVSKSHSLLEHKDTATTKSITMTARPLQPSGRLLQCGYDSPRHFYPYLFPGMNFSTIEGYSRRKKNYYTADDFLLFGMHGPCDGTRAKTKTKEPHVQEKFPGKALFLNTEPRGDGRGHNTFQIGLLPDSNRSVLVYSVVIFLVAGKGSKYDLNTLLDHTQKPRNTGERGVIYMASRCVQFREKAADLISDINPQTLVVEYGGSCKGNRSRTESKLVKLKGRAPKHTKFENNIRLYRKFRYCLVLENSQVDMYISEKIALAFLAGCIPVYYGTTKVFDLFNPNAFIFYDVDHPDLALEQIQYLEQNQSAYQEMLDQPILANGTDTIERYFSLRDDVGGGKLIRRIREMLGYSPHPPMTVLQNS